MVLLKARFAILAVIICPISILTLTSCLPTYLVKSSYNQIKILNEREPISKVLERNDITPELRHKLELALEVRAFAEKELKLKPTENYKTFVDLKRPYVSWVVSAAKKDALEPHNFWYPVVGSLPYKGFFTKEEAEAEAQSLKIDGFDVVVRGVTAYSTLGWFDDPLLSSMVDGADHGLVNVIIHESTHATLYIKSQAEFNERLATYMGNLGTELFYQKREGQKSSTLKQIADDNGDERAFSEFITREMNELKEWYEKEKKPIPEDRRQEQFKNIQTHFTKELLPKLKTKNYQRFAASNLNNAVLIYYRTYEFDLSDFDKLYDKLDRNLEKFISYCRTLEKSKDPSLELKSFLSSSR